MAPRRYQQFTRDGTLDLQGMGRWNIEVDEDEFGPIKAGQIGGALPLEVSSGAIFAK
jgi:hypothetical protein